MMRVGPDSYMEQNVEPSLKSGYNNIVSLKEVWKKRFLSGVSNRIIVSKNTAIISFLNGEVTAVRIEDGTQVGRRKMGKGPVLDLKLKGENIYFALPRERKQIRSYNMFKGSFNWRRSLIGGSNTIFLDSLYLFVGTKNGITALNQADGSKVWEKNENYPIGSSLISHDKQLLYSDLRGHVICRKIKSGDLNWKTLLSAAVLYGQPLAIEGILIGTTLSGLVFSLSLLDGAIIWKKLFEEPIYTSPVIHNDMVIVASSSGDVQALRLQDGELIWTFETGELLSQPVLIENTGFILITTQKGDIYITDVQNGNTIWHQKIDARIMVEPTASGDVILISDDQKHITAYQIIPSKTPTSN